MALGQLRGSSRETVAPLHCPNQVNIVASGALEVCDGDHSLGVMKEGLFRWRRVELLYWLGGIPYDEGVCGAARRRLLDRRHSGFPGFHCVRISPRRGTRKHCPVFPVLRLEEVYGAITYYLGHQEDVDSYLRDNDREFEALRAQARQANPGRYKKLEEARQQLHTPHPFQENKEAINAKIERGLAQLDRGEGLPGDQLRARLAADKAAWLADRSGS